MPVAVEGGGGGSNPNAPGPADYATAAHNRQKPAPAAQPPPTTYHPPGATGPPPRDPFAPWERGSQNTARDQALAITEHFLEIMGWPAGIDERALEMGLLTQGLELSPSRAYNWLYTQISKSLQDANPNAEFGMTQDSYISALNAMKDQFETLTGNPDIPPDVLRMAIDQGWTQSELSSFLQKDARYSNPALLPWLQQGMTYRDVKSQFFQTYGRNPTDGKQLASWFNFRSGAQQVGGEKPVGETAGAAPTKPQGTLGQTQSEIR